MTEEQPRGQPGQGQAQQQGRARRNWLKIADISLLVAGLASAGLSLRGSPTEGYLNAPYSLWSKAKKGYMIERVICDVPNAVINLDYKLVTDKLPNFDRMGRDMRNFATNAYELWPKNADTLASPFTSYIAMIASYLPFGILRKFTTKPLRRLLRR